MTLRYLMMGATIVMLAGCAGVSQKSDATQLYVYDGPLAANYAGHAIEVTSGGGLDRGFMSYRLPDGEICKGDWKLISQKFGDVKASARGPGEGHTIRQDGGISPGGNGGGAYVRHGKAGSLGEGRGTCSNGATFEFAFKTNGHQARGALRDSTGNIFTMALR